MNLKLVFSFVLSVPLLGSISSLASSEEGVVRSRTVIPVLMSSSSRAGEKQLSKISNTVMSSLTLDSSKFKIPSVSNAPLSFGSLSLSTLLDTNLFLCGPTHNLRCNTATIRLYTTGAGPGIFNAAEGYGMPIRFSNGTVLDGVVGFGVENATTLQTLAIDPKRYTVRLSDFGEIAHYNFASDFTDAGAGSFATTIVFEYVLSLVP